MPDRHGGPTTPASRERARRSRWTALLALLGVLAMAEMAPTAGFVAAATPVVAAGDDDGDDDDHRPPNRKPPLIAPPELPPASEPVVPESLAPASPEPAPSLATAIPTSPLGEPSAGSSAPAPAPGPASQREVAGVDSAAPSGSPPPVSVSDRLVEVSAAGTASIPLVCRGPAACGGTIVLEVAASASKARVAGTGVVAARRGRKLRIGKASFSVAAGTTGTVRVRMSRRGRKLLGRSGRIRAKATIVSAGTSTSFPVTLRASRGGPRR